MSGAPSEEQTSETRTNRRRIWATTGLTLGAIVALGAAGGALWAWIFVNERLSPWLSELLTESIDRPVALGEVERVSLTGIQLGPSAIPPTETDPDTLYVDSINVRFNPLQLLGRQIRPQINLVGVQGYIEQDQEGLWTDVEIDLGDEDADEDPFIRVHPTVGIQDSELVLLPYLGEGENPLPLTLGNINGTVTVASVEVEDPLESGVVLDAQQIDLDLRAAPENAGQLIVNGVIQQLDYDDAAVDSPLDRLDANMTVQAQQLDLAVLSPSILASVPGDLPLTVTSGILNGNLEADLTPQDPPQITGTARLQSGAIAVDGLPKTIDNITAQARFQGNRVALEDVTAQYANLTARGGGLIDTRNGYDLTAQIAPFELSEIAEELELEFPIEAAGTFVADASMTGPLADPNITGSLTSTSVTTIDRVQFASIATELVYVPEAIILSSLDVVPLEGGSLTGSGIYTFADPAELSLQVEGQDLPADAIGRAYGLPETITLGAVDIDADISGPINNLGGVVSWQAPDGDYPTRGTAEVVANTVRVQEAIVAVAGGIVSGTGTLEQGQWDADLIAQDIQLGEFDESLEGAIAAGAVQLAGSLDDLTLQGIRGSGDITASLRGGTLTSQVALANGNWDADVQTRDFPVSQFIPDVPVSTVSADASLSGNIENLTLEGILGNGTVTAAIAGGTVTSDFLLENGFWQADGEGNNLQLGQLVADLQGTGNATFQLAGSFDNLTPAGIRGRANITLSDGLATVASLSPQLANVRAPLEASLEWDGRDLLVSRLDTAGLSANGTITPIFSGPEAPGIAAIDLAIAARDYALAALPIDFPPALALTGQATFDGRLTGSPDDLNLAGDLALANLALNDLVFDPLLAGDVQFSSREGLDIELLGQEDEIVVTYDVQPRQLNFRVQADEAVAIGQTEGNLLQTQIYNFPISVLNIPPDESNPYGPLRGEVTFAAATVDLRNLSTVGQVDVANLGFGYFSVDRVFGGFAYANGVASVNNGEIRMSDTNPRGEVLETRIYELSGRYAVRGTPQIQAAISTEEGQLRDILEILKVSEIADFRRGFVPTDGFIPASQEEAERLLATTPAGNPNDTLLNQLRRLSEIIELEIQEDLETETATLPPLDELQGEFRGGINLSANIPDDINVAFDIEGDDWTWGSDLSADTVLAQGSYQNGTLFFDPLRFETGEGEGAAFINLAGDFSLDPADPQTREIELTVANLPAENLQEIANLPFDLGGRLNGNATLQGRLAAPTLAGNLELVDGTLNREPIDRADANFTYTEGRLGLDANLLLVDSDDPLTLSAQVPYELPFLEEPPIDNSFLISANVRDEGFALLNVFTQEVAWESGQGEAILRVEGNIFESSGNLIPVPTAFDGIILLQGATISFSALPDPMTDITGQIRLDPSNLAVVVDRLTGQFSDGELRAQGTFPLVQPLSIPEEIEDLEPEDASTDEPESEMVLDEMDAELDIPPTTTARPLTQIPLTLALDNIDLDLKGLYNGQANGEVVLGGSLQTGPMLTGEIDLSDGIITIPEGDDSSAFIPVDDTRNNQLQLPPLQFSDLRLVLARNVRIVEGALLNVEADGGLRIDGTIADLRPFGTIRLPSGRVELFATSLRLAGENDRAEFRGDFDAILDVTLQTSLPDVAGQTGIQPTTSPFPQNEIPDPAIEGLGLTQQGNGLVRINARYRGPASELSSLQTDLNNLELSSSPPRSNNELIALLSRNVLGAFDTLQDGDDALAGLATFAGSALLQRARDFLGDTIPLSEFRIFQASESTGQVNDAQDIGIEIGVDVRPNISVSVLRVLTNDTPFQFNVRYRISDQFTLRGTTSFEDFNDRTGVLLEYETRF